MFKPKFAIAAVLLACAAAWAQDTPDEAATAKAQAAEKAQPANPDKKKQPIRRRSVQLQVDSMAGPEAYRPILQPRAPLVAAPPRAGPPPASTALNPPPPVQLNSCDQGGCTDINGTRYNGGVGNAVTGPQGRLCTRSGATVTCF